MTVARSRLLRALSAQIYGQGVSIGVQLGLVPVLLGLWGVRTYGIWLLVSAVPSYLAFSDLGFTYVAKNLMVSQVAAGDRAGALRTFHSIFGLLNVVAPLVLLAAGLALALVDLPGLIGIGAGDARTASLALLLLIAAVLVYQYFLLICAGVRSENRPARESMFGATARLIEAAGIATVAVLGGEIVAAAAATLAVRLAYSCHVYGWLRRASPWLWLGHAHGDRAEVRALLHPAIGFALIPVAQALLIQGPVLILGAVAGPAGVVLFSTARTLTRMGTAATNVLNNTFVTEYAYLFGLKRMAAFLALLRRHLLSAVVMGVIYAGGVMLFGRWALDLITHGKAVPELALLALMAGGVAGEMLSSSLLTPLTAANRHPAASHFLLLASGIGIALCYPAARLAGLDGVAGALLATQLLVLAGFAYLLRRGLRTADFRDDPAAA